MDAGSISLAVHSNLGEKPEEAGLRPIQDIIPIEPIWMRFLPWAAALAGLLFVIAGLTWWHRRRHFRDHLGEVGEPPHIKAGKEIDRLEKTEIRELGYKQYKEFFPLILMTALVVLMSELILAHTVLRKVP